MLQETTLFGKQQIKTSITLLKIVLNGLDVSWCRTSQDKAFASNLEQLFRPLKLVHASR